MKKIKILTAFGTRPEAVKMAPLVKELQSREAFDCKVLVTAQHREMLDSVLELFQIVPDFDLNIMAHKQTLTDITSRILYGCDEVFSQFTPDLLLVHGDTSTTFACALAAFYKKIKVGHVEAGLRTDNIYSPYPEEMNRRLTTRLTNVHFAPTKVNKENLLKENVSAGDIEVTGNTVIDALMDVVKPNYQFNAELMDKLIPDKRLILLTCHRRENWGEPMENIFGAVRRMVDDNPEVQVVFPMHMNPLVREIAKRHLDRHDRIHLIEPLEYEPFANLMGLADFILTDSGGIQEEAPSLGKPVMVLRTETERPEAVAAGTVKVVGVTEETIYYEGNKLIRDPEYYRQFSNAANPYGDGTASKKIADAIRMRFGF